MGGELPGCSATGGECSPACAEMWGSIFDACDGQSVSLFGGEPQLFQPARFAASVASLGMLGSGVCSSAPLQVALSRAGESLGCEDSLVLLSAGGVKCGGISQAVCSQTCQDVIEASMQSCSPLRQPSASDPSIIIDARSQIQQHTSLLSPTCRAVFQPLFEEWQQGRL